MKIYNKLVRDNIPSIIKSSGRSCHTHIASKDEYMERLENKLQEETLEFLEAKNKEGENLEELADIMEVVFALANALGYSEEELIKKRQDKFNERGGFKEGIVLEKVYD
ncbi:phosphoribosyl-ATP pyrophosphohydrolase [Haloimpatiens sp. FM7315]|uniref:phosphoribosyl-ATP pyrophosphohydrolase n=1 Tax=Haloimpatiens sp. FM7315 TaxID=3298609 RepID=UPI0035A341E2